MTRIDKEKNLTKVTVALVNNPLGTQRDIAKQAWIWLSTANRSINELEQTGTKSKAIEEIINNDTKITQMWQKILLERMETKEVNNRDILTAIDQAAKRRSIFIGEATDFEWGSRFAQIVQLPPRWNNE